MIRKLRLQNFKNFRDATLPLGNPPTHMSRNSHEIAVCVLVCGMSVWLRHA
jgi:hypothetical protein